MHSICRGGKNRGVKSREDGNGEGYPPPRPIWGLGECRKWGRIQIEAPKALREEGSGKYGCGGASWAHPAESVTCFWHISESGTDSDRQNKKLCYGRGTTRCACRYRKKLAVDEWPCHTPKVITVAAIIWRTVYHFYVCELLFQHLYVGPFQDSATFEINVTACDLENSNIFDNKA